MRKTGRINPITKQEIFQMEESDIKWKDCDFDDLNINEQADILSVLGLTFLNSEVKPIVIERYNKLRNKNLNL